MLSGRSPEFALSAFQVDAAESILRGIGSGTSGATMVSAGTGSGKTLAFYLPVLSDIAGTDASGAYAFDTVKPGAVPDPDGVPQAPHILLAVFARGMLRHLYTRIYFEDEAGNAIDPVLALVPADRRATLIARQEGSVYKLDLRLQGGDETVFFDV